MPAWPAGRLALHHDDAQALGGGVDGRGQAGRSGADDAEVVERLLGAGAQPEPLGELDGARRDQGLGVGHQHQRQVLRCRLGQLGEPLAFLVDLHVEPQVRHVVAGQERLDLIAALGPAVPDHADVDLGERVLGAPVVEQVVDDGVEPVLGRVPRLEQVVVQADLVDRRDRDVGVGVRRHQQVLRRRCVRARLGEQLDAGHAGHPLVGHHERDRAAAQRELGEDLQRLGTRRRPDDPELLAVARPQVARQRSGDRLVVVDGQDRGSGQRRSRLGTSLRRNGLVSRAARSPRCDRSLPPPRAVSAGPDGPGRARGRRTGASSR